MIGPSMKVLDTHCLQLTVHGFNPLAIQAQIILVGPRIRRHIAATDGDKANASSRENSGGSWVRDVAFITKDGGTFRQAKGQFVDGRQILLRRRQQVKTDRDSVRRTNQVQAPAKELLLL